MSYYRNQLENWLKTIDIKADSVFDIGGASNPVKNRVKSWEVKDYFIFDNGIEQGDYTYPFDLNYSFENNETRYSITLPNKTDIVFCLEVFEYIFDPVTAIKNIANFLHREGIAYISFPFVYPHHNPLSMDFLRYTYFGIQRLLAEGDFSRWEINERVDKSGLLQGFYKADGMHPLKNFNNDVTGFLVKAIK